MVKNGVTPEQRRLSIDLWIVVLVSLVFLGIGIVLQSQLRAFVLNSEKNILLRVLCAASLQFGIAGLGITIVSIVRKENFRSYGLRAEGAIPSILLCILCFVPHIIFMFTTRQITGYLPFQSIWTMKDVLASKFPQNIIGLLITTTSWGFFEGFNYVVISDKINKKYPSKNKWLNWGAIICAILCILIHGMIGVSMGSIIEMLTIIIIIYGMLMVKKFTYNAWGCVFIFVFLWNAF